MGISHGDLHEDNVLVPRANGVLQPEQFRLVDLSTFDDAAPLSRDLAMMAVSFAARRVPDMPPGQREALLDYLVRRSDESVGHFPAAVQQMVDALRYASTARFTAARLDDNWDEQLLLSVQATALQHLSFATLGEDTRWWLFRLAAHAGAEFLRSRGRFRPEDPRQVDQALLTGGRATPSLAAGTHLSPGTARRDPSAPGAARLAVHDEYRRTLLIVAPATREPANGGSVPAGAADLGAVVDSFAALGYRCTPDHIIAADDAEEVRGRLSAALEATGPGDVVTLYVAGDMEVLPSAHSGVTARRLVLHTTRSQAGRARGTVSIEALVEGIYDRPSAAWPSHLLVILDVAAADGGDVFQELRAAVPPLRPADPDVSTGTGVLAVIRPPGQAWTPRFPAALRDAVSSPAVAPRTASYLELAAVTDALRAALAGQRTVEMSVVSQRGPLLCLPNARHHLDGINPADMEEWWEPTARGASGFRGTGEAPWLFSGRRRLNRELARWLRMPDEPVLVLTGAPGSGKSTVLARTVVMTVPDVRRSLVDRPDALRPEETPPEDFRFAIAIRAHQLSADALAARIAAATGLRRDREPVAGTTARKPPGVILIDGVDEAEDPHQLVAEVLRPLVLQAAEGGPRLLIATRNQPLGYDPADPLAVRGDLVTPLVSDGGTALDVGSPDWLETGDIAEYCERLLSAPVNDAGRRNPYATAPAQRRVLARSIETQSRHSFLLAAHVARRHTLDADFANPLDPQWIAQFPRKIGDAMRQEVEAVYGVAEAGRQLALLRPLAFAEGAGLVRETRDSDLWALLATRLDPDGRPFTTADVDELLRHRVATHLVSRADKGGSAAYRFHHEALAESFIAGRADETAANRAITGVLLAALGPAGARDWSRASSYARRALPGHARRAGMLGSLTDDPGLYGYCDPDRLHEALVSAADPALTALSRLLRPYLHRLRVLAPPQRAFLLSLAARVTGDDELARGLEAAARLPARTLHVRVRHEALRQGLAEGQPVGALAATEARDGSPLVFVANGRFIDVRDPDSGALVETVLSGLSELSALVPYTDGDGFPVVAAAAADGAKIWDVTTRALRGQAGANFGRGMVVGRRGGTAFLAGWSEDQVAVWDTRTGSDVLVLPVRWEPGEQPITSVTVVRDASGSDRLAVAAGGKVSIWDPATGRPTDSVDLPAGEFNLQLASLQPSRPDGLLLITTGLNDKRALLWRSSHGARAWPFPDIPICTASGNGASGEQVMFGYATGSVRLWNCAEDVPPRPIQDAGMTMLAAEIGPAGSENPAAVAVDVVGEIRVWDLNSTGRSVTLSGSSPHALAMGSLRQGGRYLVIGRNNGADLWRLDEVTQDRAAHDLHDNDTQRIVAAGRDGSSLFATAGNDGRLQVWDGRSGKVTTALPIPTGSPYDLIAWTAGGDRLVAVTSAAILLVFRIAPDPRLLLTRELDSPGRMAYLDRAGTGLLAVGDRQQIHLVDPASLRVRHLPVPAEEGRSAAARNVVSLTWVRPAGPDPVLVAGTQGGMVVAWPLRDGHPGAPSLLADGTATVIVLHPYPGGDGTLVLAGSTTGELRVYDTLSGRQVFDLTKDDARIVGAATAPTAGLVVTAHVARNANGLRVWDPQTGTQLRSVVRGPADGNAYTGTPRAGTTALGRPFVAYATEDGVELLWLDNPSGGEAAVRLSLPVTVNDVDVLDDLVYVAGGGGYLMLRIVD
ncbi:MAG TPA: hypothetical protein VGD91_19675 [Trebonia sp.]